MKAIILCAGKGTRLRPLTYTTAKHLIPVANKPVILYTIEKIKSAGIKEIGIIVSPENRQDFITALGDGSQYGVNLTYILQEEPKGLAHAVLMAKHFLGDEDFMMYLGDNLIMDDIRPFVKEFEEKKELSALIMLSPVQDPSRFGIAVMEGNKIIKIESLVEKPKPEEAPSNIAIIGRYVLNPTIFDCLSGLNPGYGGEIQLTDALKILCKREAVYGYLFEGKRYDIGGKSEWLRANFELALEDGELRDYVVEWFKELKSL